MVDKCPLCKEIMQICSCDKKDYWQKIDVLYSDIILKNNLIITKNAEITKLKLEVNSFFVLPPTYDDWIQTNKDVLFVDEQNKVLKEVIQHFVEDSLEKTFSIFLLNNKVNHFNEQKQIVIDYIHKYIDKKRVN